jgi:Fe-S cluster assembly protein SufD
VSQEKHTMTTTAPLDAKQHYLEAFEAFEKTHGEKVPPLFRRLQQSAVARFDEIGFPGPKDEEWRATNLAGLLKVPFAPIRDDTTAQLDKLPQGVIIGSLLTAATRFPELVEPYLARYADYRAQPFVALNTAFLREGVFIYVPPGAMIKHPIHIRHTVPAATHPLLWFRRCLVVMGKSSQASVVEIFESDAKQAYCTNSVTEVVLHENAVVDHYKLQREGQAAFHLAVTSVQQQRSSNFRSHAIQLGGAFVRNEINAVLDGEGGECTLNGVYLADENRFMENRTIIDHAKPHCNSHELYKGILDDKGKGVFNGKIFVRQDAQKTDAKQTNQTLLLSTDATINTKPQLEIFADDVKCTHGATVGHLDDNAVFYLQSRGIGQQQARNILTFAFANEIINEIKIPAMREQLEQALLTRHLAVDGD